LTFKLDIAPAKIKSHLINSATSVLSNQHQHHDTQDPTASASLDGRALKNEPIGVVAEGLGVHYVVSVKSVKFLPTT
jgi:hypothetical protein